MKIMAQTPWGDQLVMECEAEGTLMEVLKKEDAGVDGICGGMRSCASCHVHIAEAWLDRITPSEGEEKELLMLSDGYCPIRSRLACQIELSSVHDGLEVSVIG